MSQLWHADITIFKLNKVKYYIYFLVDNFSRGIIGYRISKKQSGLTVREMLSEAIQKYKPSQACLIVDGGSENNNHHVDTLMLKQPDTIKRLIAKKDIAFSNSMVEAVNKIIKNDYLYALNITSEKQLTESLEFAVNDYNNIRPHDSIGGNTPFQVLSNNLTDKEALKLQKAKARTERIATNRKNNCRKCS